MAVTELTPDLLEKTLMENEIVLIDFWSTCGPCRSFKPVFEKASETHLDLKFVSCNTQDQPELAQAFGIRRIPTLIIFREQVLILNQTGALPPPALEKIIQNIKALDMDEVRKRVAEQEKQLASKDQPQED